MSPAVVRGSHDDVVVGAASHEVAVKDFRLGLFRLWQSAGKPSAEEMARHTEIPESVFAMFLADTALSLPSAREVDAILAGTGQNPEVSARWKDRFLRLELERAELDRQRVARNRAANGLPPQQPGDLADLVGSAIDVDPPLAAALEATTKDELQAALQDLRVGAKLSVREIEKITRAVPGGLALSRSTAQRIEKGERVPARDQVVAFARACGQDQRAQRLWGRAADRVARLAAGEPDPAAAGQVEVSLRSHPVQYLGKAPDDQRVLRELRLQVTPKLKTVAYTTTGVTALTLAGLVLAFSKPNSPARLALGIGVGVGAGAAALRVRKRINTMTDDEVKKMAKVLIHAAAVIVAGLDGPMSMSLAVGSVLSDSLVESTTSPHDRGSGDGEEPVSSQPAAG